MKKYIKILIPILIVIILICCIGLYFINKNQEEIVVEENEVNILVQEDTEIEENIDEPTEMQRVKDNNTYYTVTSCIEKLLGFVKKENKEGILDLLDKSYVESEKINADNLNKYIKSLGKYQKLYTSEIYEKNDGIKGKRFFVKGKQAIGYNKEENIDIWYVIKVNNDESRFSIIPYYEEAEVSDLENNYKNDGEILENNENFFVMKYATDDYMAKEYFYNFQYSILYDYKNFYNKIDEEYKNKRFGNKEGYLKYIKDNTTAIDNMTLQEYRVKENLDYTEYICLDNRSNYYTIKATDVMEYTIILDDYTIKTAEFVEEYNSSEESQKVYTNIEIFIKMINNKDYDAAYGVLNETFRENNFETVDVFAEYMKNNFFDYTIIDSIKNMKKSGSYYVCEFNTSSGIALSSEKGKETFIVALNDGTDFELSFDTTK